jgi:hypothetical protein
MAGYRPHHDSPYQLRENPGVKDRMAEIGRRMMRKTEINIETLINDLAADRKLARELGQPSAAIAATHLTAKLCGFLIDRKETGQPGAFEGLQTVEEILARCREELGDEAAELLSKALERQDRLAIDHEPGDMAKPNGHDQV